MVVQLWDLNVANFEPARRMIAKGLEKAGFDVIRGYIFGDALAERTRFQPVGGMPTFGGYRTVQNCLKRSGFSIEEATFLPTQDIIRGLGLFD